MKKTIKIALLLCLILLMSTLVLTACNSKDNPAPEETSQHIWSEWIVIKEAKCEENGLLQRYCTECNYTESKPIDALGHTEVIVQVVAPTCTQNGWTEGKYCSTCNEVFVVQATIDALRHSYTSTITPPTATENGNALYTCSNCGDTYTEVIVPTAFTITEDHRTMIGYTGEEGENLIIPAVFQHNGTWYRVTTIDDYAFSSCDNLTSVTIPDSVTTIGHSAFSSCDNLTSVTIPDSVTTIDDWAFYGCSNLTSIVVDENNPAYQSINGNLYSKDGTVLIAYAIGKTDTSFTIPDSVTTIDDYAFSSCDNLTSVTIPDSVTTIGDQAFHECSNLTEITIPDSVTTIGNAAFGECSNLTSVTIGNSVTTIGSSAFWGCYKLVEVINKSSLTITAGSSDNGYVAFYAKEVHNGTTKIVNQNNYLFYTYNGVNYLLGYVGTDTALTLPENYNGQNYEIYQYTFYLCDNLTSVTIPDSVTTIGESAFYYCYNLTSVAIGDSVTTIGSSAFWGCYKLVEVINKSSLTITAGSYANGYVGYYAKEVHKGTTKIVNQNNYLFYTYNGVNYLLGYGGTDTVLTLPENYNGQNYEIYQYAFQYCSNLTSVTIPDSVTTIGEVAFCACDKLTSVTIGDSVTTIGNFAFEDCFKLTSVTIGNSVTTIGDHAFYGCTNLTSVTIGDSVTTISYWAFAHCYNLTSITFEGTVAQWKAISKGDYWKYNVPATSVICSDGTVTLN